MTMGLGLHTVCSTDPGGTDYKPVKGYCRCARRATWISASNWATLIAPRNN